MLRAPTTLHSLLPVPGNLEPSEAETSRLPQPLVVEHGEIGPVFPYEKWWVFT